MKKTMATIFSLVGAVLLRASAQAAEPRLESELTGIIQVHLAALDSKDLDKALSVVHSESREFNSLKSGQPSMFAHFTYRHVLSSFTLIGFDERYAYLSLTQKKTKLEGPETGYDNTVSDVLVAFRKEGADWKIWRQVLLDWTVLGGKPKAVARAREVGRKKVDVPQNCRYHLRVIDSRKEQYAMEKNLKKGAKVSLSQLSAHFGGNCFRTPPICPDGGEYTINAIGEKPVCSMKEHKLD